MVFDIDITNIITKYKKLLVVVLTSSIQVKFYEKVYGQQTMMVRIIAIYQILEDSSDSTYKFQVINEIIIAIWIRYYDIINV